MQCSLAQSKKFYTHTHTLIDTSNCYCILMKFRKRRREKRVTQMLMIRWKMNDRAFTSRTFLSDIQKISCFRWFSLKIHWNSQDSKKRMIGIKLGKSSCFFLVRLQFAVSLNLRKSRKKKQDFSCSLSVSQSVTFEFQSMISYRI